MQHPQPMSWSSRGCSISRTAHDISTGHGIQAQPREPSCSVGGCRESRPGTLPAQSTPTRSLDGVAMGPGRWSSSGLYMGLTLLICVRLSWARAVLHSSRRSCWTSPTGSSRVEGDLPGTPPPQALHLPQPLRDPSGAECEAGSTGSWLWPDTGQAPANKGRQSRPGRWEQKGVIFRKAQILINSSSSRQ